MLPTVVDKKRTTSLLRSSGIVAGMTMLSRVLGMARDIVIALFFGAIAGVDAFFVAFKIPNFLRRLFAEGAFSQAFVPVLSECQQTRSHEEVKLFISHTAGNLGIILLGVTLLAIFAAPVLVMVFAPGFIHDPVRYEMASSMLRITFPYLMLISLTAMAGAVLNTYRSFAVPAFTPVLLNISLIAAALYLAPQLHNPVTALAWGVLIAGFMQLLLQLPFLSYKHLLPLPRINWRDPGVKRVLALMVPALFGVSVAQVNLLLDTLFASFLPVGSISWLYYSDRLTNFPLGVFGVAIATVILPHLSRQHVAQSSAKFCAALDWSLRTILIVAVPSALGLYFLAGPLLATLLGYGQFSAYDVEKARLSLMAFATGVPAFMLIKILVTGFYARQDIKTPVKIGVIAMLSNVVLNIILIIPLAHAGLALATSIAAVINAGLLFYLLCRHKIFVAQAGWSAYILRLLFANGVMLSWLLYKHIELAQWLQWGWRQRAGHLLLIVGCAILLYSVSLLLTGLTRILRSAPSPD